MNEEQILIQKCKEGDQLAQTKLYNTYQPKLMGFIIKNYRKFSREENEEVINTTFVIVFSTIKVYEGKCSFLSWLVLHVKRVAYTHIRLLTKHMYRGELINNTEFLYKIEVNDDLKIGYNPALDNFYYNDLLNKLRSILPKNDLKLILLYKDGYSRKQMGEIFNITAKSVANKLHDVKKKIKDENII